MTYEHVGNVSETYQHIPRQAEPFGLVTEPSLVLKLYSMYKTGHPLPKTLRQRASTFLRSEISDGLIKPFLGLGFAILSEDMLNVARWDTKYPIVLKNDIYCFEDSTFGGIQRVDTRDAGSFCIWELGIVEHEKEAWKGYLVSRRTEEDKVRYLNTVVRLL